jgi:hypothetical protein
MFKHWFCWKYQYNKYMFCIYLILLTYVISAYHQDSINSIIGTRANQLTGTRIHTTTHKNKTVSVNKIKYIQNMYLLYWYFQQNQCLNIKKVVIGSI